MTPRPRPISDQVIAITGASSGIGLLVARQAAWLGAKVALIARDRVALERIGDDIMDAGGNAIALATDVGDADAVARALTAIIDRFGRIDCWINDAGVAIYERLDRTPTAEHQRLFQTNYFGVVNCSLAALPHLVAARGSLVTVASIASDLPSPLLGAYAASKHAVKGFINSLRIEARAAGWPVNIMLVKPSGVDTPIAQHAANFEGKQTRVPPPVYDPEIVAKAIIHLIEHPRDQITSGGAGRLNVLIGEHFPKILNWVAPVLIPILTPRPPDAQRSEPLRTPQQWPYPLRRRTWPTFQPLHGGAAPSRRTGNLHGRRGRHGDTDVGNRHHAPQTSILARAWAPAKKMMQQFNTLKLFRPSKIFEVANRRQERNVVSAAKPAER